MLSRKFQNMIADIVNHTLKNGGVDIGVVCLRLVVNDYNAAIISCAVGLPVRLITRDSTCVAVRRELAARRPI